ncbi:hypothetical protein Clacol_010364 [Clathrus columnatus]|uniref:F-box domain-containing protein n=1 Tax=Clathrus columnatus TaxID=1419009 RepID=A0AAV5ATM4_9AGAM|nr:hypothetical protein Clacol_007000 [Clathrus columnatus]GJJ16085.1 hypothetical protein Clacol_010364 [Clathrus columnatus]
MSHFLENRDIADQIFAWISPHTLTVTARVSRAWFEASIPKIWKDVELKTVLSLLGTFETLPQNNYYRFTEVPNEGKWNRFSIYSSYVLSLKGMQRDRFALEMAVNSRPDTVQYLFPRCGYLSWRTSSDEGLIDLSSLITQSLDHLVLQVHDLTYSFFAGICQSLHQTSPELRFLQLDITEQQPTRAAECCDLVYQLLTLFAKRLRFVQIPEVFNTTEVLQKLYELSNLYHLMVNVRGLILYDPRILTKTDGDYQGRGGFTSLQTLSFGGSQESLCDKFLKLTSLSSLQTLRWYLEEELKDARSFIQTVADGCPQLQILEVGNSRMYFKPDCVRPVVPWYYVRPILQCRKLTVLMLHCFQVQTDPKEFIEFLRNRATWTGIGLFTTQPLRMIDLFLFAKFCPNLKNLGVFVNDFLGLHLAPDYLNDIRLTFPSLTSVDFAFSTFPEEMAHSVALFFFRFCKEPPYFGGWDLLFWDDVSFILATLYVKKERLTGIPMSAYARKFVDQSVKVKNLIDDTDIDLDAEESEYEYDGSGDEDVMTIDG